MSTNKKTAGRRPLEEHEKRITCHGIRLKAYWLFWLKQHKRVGARMIEEALAEHFAPNEQEIIREFYDDLWGIKRKKK